MTQATNRIEYVDLAKGICILLVVFSHSALDYGNRFDTALTSFRMPLYFMLSGLFFKEYSGIGEFVIRKINKLLIPFAFFYVLCAWILSAFVFGGGGINSHYFISVWYEDFNGMPKGIWFLLCLFLVNLLAYIVTIIAKAMKYEIIVFVVLCLLLGLLGYMFGRSHINLPLYLDSALSALPFFASGRILRQYTSVLKTENKPYINIFYAMICLTATYLIAYGKVNYRENDFQMVFPAVLASGFLGTLGILYMSKSLVKLPIVSYIGRYSIIVLCTHQLVIMPQHWLCEQYGIHGLQEGLIVWTITTFICYFLIEPMRSFMPYVTAQKDVFQYRCVNKNND